MAAEIQTLRYRDDTPQSLGGLAPAPPLVAPTEEWPSSILDELTQELGDYDLARETLEELSGETLSAVSPGRQSPLIVERFAELVNPLREIASLTLRGEGSSIAYFLDPNSNLPPAIAALVPFVPRSSLSPEQPTHDYATLRINQAARGARLRRESQRRHVGSILIGFLDDAELDITPTKGKQHVSFEVKAGTTQRLQADVGYAVINLGNQQGRHVVLGQQLIKR